MSKEVFLSYASANEDDAEKIRELLFENGIDVWMAKHDIDGGADFSEEIQTALEECACFVLLLTDEAQESPWVPRELDTAISLKKTVIPIQRKTINLNKAFRFNLIKTQIITAPILHPSNKGVQEFIYAVKKALGEQAELPVSAPSKKKKTWIFALMGVALIVLLLFAAVPMFLDSESGQAPARPTEKKTEDEKKTESDDFSNHIQNQLESLMQNNALPAPDAEQVNQIPDFFEDEVEAFRYADEFSRSNRTKRIKVGEKVSLSTVWNDAVVYSENTEIAVGEGTLVKGVSPGTTYVIIATSKNVSTAYCIIVEE